MCALRMLWHRREKSRFSKMRSHRRRDRCPRATNGDFGVLKARDVSPVSIALGYAGRIPRRLGEAAARERTGERCRRRSIHRRCASRRQRHGDKVGHTTDHPALPSLAAHRRYSERGQPLMSG
jgi:hypothetical protein